MKMTKEGKQVHDDHPEAKEMAKQTDLEVRITELENWRQEVAAAEREDEVKTLILVAERDRAQQQNIDLTSRLAALEEQNRLLRHERDREEQRSRQLSRQLESLTITNDQLQATNDKMTKDLAQKANSYYGLITTEDHQPLRNEPIEFFLPDATKSLGKTTTDGDGVYFFQSQYPTVLVKVRLAEWELSAASHTATQIAPTTP
jgi:hypothetical protein